MSMINLKQLLKENPDYIKYNDERHMYADAHSVFTIFRYEEANKWVGVVLFGKSPNNPVLATDRTVQEDLLFRLDPNYINSFATHPGIINVLMSGGYVDPGANREYSYRNRRPDIPVNGRIWKTDGKDLVSFWCPKDFFKKFQKEIKDCLKLADVDIKKAEFEFINHEGIWMSYDKAMGKTSDSYKATPEDVINKLLKRQHLDPNAKQALKKLQGMPTTKLSSIADKMSIPFIQLKQRLGMDIAEESLLKEDPEVIAVVDDNGHDNHYYWQNAQYTFLCGQENGKNEWIAAKMKAPFIIYHNGDEIKKAGRAWKTIHYELIQIYNKKTGQTIDRYKDEVLLGRVWERNNVFYISVWESKKAVVKFKESLFNFLKWANIDEKQVKYQISPMYSDKWLTYEELFGKSSVEVGGDKEDWELSQKLHVMPPEKKAIFLKKMGSMKPNKLQKAADKLGMTPIKLKQLLGKDIAEESILKEDPDTINVDGDSYNYMGSSGKYTFVLGKLNGFNSWAATDSEDVHVIVYNKNTLHFVKNIRGHSDLINGLDDYEIKSTDVIMGRIFLIKNTPYITFWDRKTEVVEYKEQLIDFLNWAEISSEEAYYQFYPMDFNKWLSSNKVFGDNTKEIGGDEENYKLQRQLHLMPPEKKAVFLKKMGAMKPDKIQVAADKLNMTPIKLKQLLGKDIAESLNESADSIEIYDDEGNAFYITIDDMENVIAVVCVGDIKFEDKKYTWVGAAPDGGEVYLNGKLLEGVTFNGETHTELIRYIQREHPNFEYSVSRFEAARKVHGRIFHYEDTYYVAFWEGADYIKKEKDDVIDFIKFFTNNQLDKVRIKPGKVSNDTHFSLSEFFDINIKQTKSDEESDLEYKLHLMPPEKKAAFLKKLGAMSPDKLAKVADKLGITKIELRQLLGKDVAEEVIKESPDRLSVDDEYYRFTDGEAKYTFILYDAGWMSTRDRKNVYVNGNEILPVPDENVSAHGELIDFIYNRIDGFEPDINSNADYWGRVYYIDNHYYVTFWGDRVSVLKYKKQLIDFLNWADITPENSSFQPSESDELISYDKFFGNENIKRTKTKNDIEFIRKLHLMPPEKKSEFLKILGAAGPDKLAKLASLYNMTPIELRQLLGRDVAENSLGNLSFSDYHDPSIPYEAKPRPNVGFQYGTVFEWFTRKRKRFN